MQALVHFINSLLKPNFSNIKKRKYCLTQSKVFPMSNLIIIPCSPDFLLEWIALWTKIMLSMISLYCMKPPWFSEIKSGINLLLRSYDFCEDFISWITQRDGENMKKLNVFNSLGIRSRKDELVEPPNFSFTLVLFNILNKSLLENFSLRPSWPWDCIEENFELELNIPLDLPNRELKNDETLPTLFPQRRWFLIYSREWYPSPFSLVLLLCLVYGRRRYFDH